MEWVIQLSLMQLKEKSSIKYKLFKVKDSKIHMSASEMPGWSNFCYRKGDGGEGFVFVPEDNKISIYRTQDFSKISELTCDLVSEQSVVKNSNSGLVLFENDSVWLLNKK